MKLKEILLLSIIFTSCKIIQYEYAFVSNREDNLDIYTSLKSTPPVNITNDKEVDYGLTWSPDGKLIVFAKQVNKHYNLLLYNTESKKTERLTNDSSDYYGPGFSPDGKLICFSSTLDDKLNEIYTMELDTKNIKRITSNDRMESSPAFHPDGKRIFYASFMDRDSANRITNSEIFVTDMNGSYHTRLTNRPGNDGALDISPNGKKIACHYFLNGKADIYTMDLDGTNIKQLTSGSSDYRWPRWTPDGKYLAYTTVKNDDYKNSDIWIMKANGKNKKEYTVSAKRDEILEFRPFIKNNHGK